MINKKVVLITGAGREEGLGFETARQLAVEGYTVIITARNEDRINALAAKLQQQNLDVIPYVLDVDSDQQVAEAAVMIDQKYGRLDGLINNAAIMSLENLTITGGDLLAVNSELETNVISVWRMMKAMVPLLKKSKSPRVVNVSSGMGSYHDDAFGLLKPPMDFIPVYSLSKLLLNGLTIKAALELKQDNILVNAVCPDFTATYAETKKMGARPVEEGAAGIVWGITIPDDGPSGGFFRDGKVLAW